MARYREYIQAQRKKGKKTFPQASVAESVSEERDRIRHEYFRKSRAGYRARLAAVKAGQVRLW